MSVAAELIGDRVPALLITHGITACGKSWLSERLIPAIHAVRVRSDLERKRLAGLEPLEPSGSGVGEKLYAADVTNRVYGRLSECAESALAAGFSVIVDASFLGRDQREQFRQLAVRRHVPFMILSCQANTATLNLRLENRTRARRDPSEATRAVLDHQLATAQPLTAQEQAHALLIDTNALTTVDAVVNAVKERLLRH